ncbi:MAG TPA: glycoside hydrolase family 97 catalytic domain-containing protein, partial [Verrucomicrobiae bacterium]
LINMRMSSRLARAIGIASLSWAIIGSASANEVASPDGAIQFRLFTNQNRLEYEITAAGNPVIERSNLGIIVDGQELGAGASIVRQNTSQKNETYPTRGIHSAATNHYNGLELGLINNASGIEFRLEVRAFNDGIGFRHIIPVAQKEERTPNENTVFRLPDGSVVWHHDLGGHYEAVHKKSKASAITNGDWSAPPMTFKLPGNRGYASITEAALWNYSGMALQADGQRGFAVRLGHEHPISYPFRLRYSNDVDRVTKPAVVRGEITSPWRVVMIGCDLNTLVNSDIVANLCPPPDPALFPKGMATDWVKSGRAVWKYLDGGANSFEQMKDFSRWAGELGFEYHVIEGFWSRWSDDQIKELVDYSRARGIGLWLWRHSRELRTPAEQDEFFERLNRLGVVGAKIDFFDHEHKDVIDLYTTLLQKAARHKIMLNFHGANKPTGESKTWPNELIREGVRGMEASRLKERAVHDVTLPFTRYLAGPADYTPTLFSARRGDTTWTHQIATAAVFNEPLLTYGANPTNLLSNPAVEMIKLIPSVWEQMIVLPPSEIGEVVVFARRAKEAWFLAVLNGPEKRDLKIPLSFLPAKSHPTLVVRDDESDSAKLETERKIFNERESIELHLNPGGGYIARFADN